MAPFEPIFAQDGSHGLWEASGMPPNPPNIQKTSKCGFGAPGALWAPICPLKAVANIFNNPKQGLNPKQGSRDHKQACPCGRDGRDFQKPLRAAQAVRGLYIAYV